MNIVARFEKVSLSQFEKDFPVDWLAEGETPASVYNSIILPARATAGSAGYDFHSTLDAVLAPGESLLLPTGLRALIEPGWVLMLFPRSGLGFKYRLQLDNTVGIIDSDYSGAKNEGHIFLRMTNDTRNGKTLEIHRGDAIAQGLFLPFGLAADDQAHGVRTGGMGSTDKVQQDS